MMVRIYVVSWDASWYPSLPADQFLPLERQVRLAGASAEKVMQAVAAYGLLRFGVRQILNLTEIPELTYGDHGKPAFLHIPSLHFNLSHTECMAACAFAGTPVGIDVERICPVSPERAGRLQLPETPGAFYEGWVERESRIKCRGGQAWEGRRAIPARGKECYHPLPLGEAYVAGVCVEEPDAIQVEYVPVEILFQSKILDK